MGLSESNIAAQVLENLSKIETELAKLDVARDEQREATEKLNKEFQETLDVLVNMNSFLDHLRASYFVHKFNWHQEFALKSIQEGVRNVDRHKDVKNKIEELENMALEREAEVQRLKVEKESVQKDIARFRMESGHEMEMLLWVFVSLLVCFALVLHLNGIQYWLIFNRKHYNELHAEMMKKKYATAEHSDDGNDE